MSDTPPPGASATVSTLRPRPEKMSEFLPLWNKRNAHIEAASTARSKLEVLTAEGGASSDRLKELEDNAAMHDAEAQSLTAQMAELQYQP